MARTDSKTALRIAKRQVSLGIGAEGLVGAVRVTGGLVLLNADGSASRLRLESRMDLVRDAEEAARPRTDLVHEHQGTKTLLDFGSAEDMGAVVEAVASRIACRASGRVRRKMAVAAAAALALCAAAAGGFVIGAGPPPGAMPAAFPMPAGGPAAPASAPGQVGSVLTPERVEQMLRAAAAERGFTRVEQPVPLDAPAATPAAPQQRPAAAPQPAAPAPPPVATPPEPRAESPAAAPMPVAAAEPPAASATVAAAAQATPADPAVPEDPEAAQRLLATLQEMRQRLTQGGEVTPDMLASLPPAIAERLRAAQAGQPAPQQAAAAPGAPSAARLSAQTLARAGRDPYGIPDVPEANTWAGTNGRVRLPLPGGGDIRKPEEMELFGLEP